MGGNYCTGCISCFFPIGSGGLAMIRNFTFQDLLDLALTLDSLNPSDVTAWRSLYHTYKEAETRAESLGLVGVGIFTYADNALSAAYKESGL